MTKILVIEDNDTLREGIVQVVKRMGHDAISAPGGIKGVELYFSEHPDLVVSDLKMDGMDGMEVLKTITEKDPTALIMIVTAFGSIEKAVTAMQEGAFDFIAKPFPPDLLRQKIIKGIELSEGRKKTSRLERENDLLREEIVDKKAVGTIEMIACSSQMDEVVKRILKVAKSDTTVHIFGESGTGKELVARAIHENSPRAKGPFVKVNCAALAESLLESELFGHEKGSFTGAIKQKLGRFELADGGTIFLDEIGDVSPTIQLKLLRAIQERQFERVGGEGTIEVDVRILTATNKDLEKEVEEGRFRQDLFFRLSVIPIVLPPLRKRMDDIGVLVEHFIGKLQVRTRKNIERVSPDALEALHHYRWPGNVRELENVIEHAMVFAEGMTIELDDLPAMLTGKKASDTLNIPKGDRSLPDILEDLEDQLIRRAYRKAKGVKTETARLLGIKASALYYKLEKYGIQDSDAE